MNAQYEFGILGPHVVTRDGRRVSVGAAQPRTLLAALLLDAGRVVPVDALVNRLGGGGQESRGAFGWKSVFFHR